MSYILIDAGNTRLKLSVIDSVTNEEIFYKSFEYPDLYNEFINNLSGMKVSNVFVSNVSKSQVLHTIADVSFYLWGIEVNNIITEQNKYGITTLYTNPGLLGADRWLALIAAISITSSTVCVIDCGSAVTLDVVTNTGIHKGGFITPGLAMSRNILGANASNLPFVNKSSYQQRKKDNFFATNTHDAIFAGTLFQLSAYIEYIITEIKNEICGNIECIITGGDAIMLQKLISHPLIYHEKLVLDGLHIVAQDKLRKDFL